MYQKQSSQLPVALLYSPVLNVQPKLSLPPNAKANDQQTNNLQSKCNNDYSVNLLQLTTSVPVKIGSDSPKQTAHTSASSSSSSSLSASNHKIRYTFGLNAFKSHSIKSVICEQPKRNQTKINGNSSSKSMESIHLNSSTCTPANNCNDISSLPPPPPNYRDASPIRATPTQTIQKHQIVEYRSTANNRKFVKQTTVDYYV